LGHNADTFMTVEDVHFHVLVFSPSPVGFYFK